MALQAPIQNRNVATHELRLAILVVAHMPVNRTLVRCVPNDLTGSIVDRTESDQGLISPTSQSENAGIGAGAIATLVPSETDAFLIIETKPALILVEDDLSVLRALRRLMLSAGFEVMAFDRPSAVLDSDLPKTNACLVVDVHLPEMNGVQLCETLAASGCRLPVIMITGRLDEATRELTRRAKALAVLFKPFTRDALLEAISEALGAVKHL